MQPLRQRQRRLHLADCKVQFANALHARIALKVQQLESCFNNAHISSLDKRHSVAHRAGLEVNHRSSANHATNSAIEHGVKILDRHGLHRERTAQVHVEETQPIELTPRIPAHSQPVDIFDALSHSDVTQQIAFSKRTCQYRQMRVCQRQVSLGIRHKVSAVFTVGL